ncbi:MAG: hypothetical protein K2I14_09400 [Eubacterium sp.]|nr:hypothetical protein [Eubacterium sp.]
MKAAKSISAIALLLSIVFLCGCSNILSILNKDNSAYYKITSISKHAEYYSSIDISGDNILFLTYKGTEDYLLSVYNAEKNKVCAKITLDDCGLDNITEAKFSNENEIIIYDDTNEKAVAYDLDLNKKGDAEYITDFNIDDIPKSDLFSDNFDFKSNYAVSHTENKSVCVFYDEPETFYVNDNDNSSFIDEYDKKIFKLSYTDNDSEIIISVEDYKNGVSSSTLKFNGLDNLSVNIQFGKLNDKYAVFILTNSNDQTGGTVSTPYIWKYNENSKNNKINLSVKTKEDFDKDNENIIKEVNDTYAIRINVDEVIEDYWFNETEYGVNALQLNSILTDIEKYLALFPDGFVNEIYSYNQQSSGIKMNIVKRIEGISAYAVDFNEDMMIVFGYDDFCKGVFFHEFMHLIDNRISDFYTENYHSDFYDEWCRLNPKDFEYIGDEYRNIDFKDYKEYFISDYAVSDMAEDAADTFRYLCENTQTDEKDKYSENVNKKIELLCKAIRSAYPSAANEDELYWEKLLNK